MGGDGSREKSSGKTSFSTEELTEEKHKSQDRRKSFCPACKMHSLKGSEAQTQVHLTWRGLYALLGC